MSPEASSPQGVELSRWRRILHPLGSAGVSGNQLSPEANLVKPEMAYADNESNIPFGMEEAVDILARSWERSEALYREALADVELRTAVEHCLTDYAETRDTDQHERSVKKFAKTGFADIVRLAVTHGRLAVAKEYEYSDDPASRTRINNIGSRLFSFFTVDNIETSPERADMIINRLMAISQHSADTYVESYGAELAMSQLAAHLLDSQPKAAATEIIASFLTCADSALELESVYARFLANNYELFGHESELGRALDIIRGSIGEGVLAAMFWEHRVNENYGQNQYTFMADIASNLASVTEFVGKIVSRFEEWPDDLSQAYAKYAQDALNQMTLRVRKMQGIMKYKPWMVPDINTVEIFSDRIWTTLFPVGYAEQEFSIRKPASKGRITESDKKSLSGFEAVREGQQVETVSPKNLKTLVRTSGNHFEPTEVDDLSPQDLVNTFIAGDGKDEQIVTFVQALEALRIEPVKGKGKHTINDRSIYIGNSKRPLKVYSANPNHIPGASGEYRRNGRILYAIDNGTIYVFKILETHDEYERYIRNLT